MVSRVFLISVLILIIFSQDTEGWRRRRRRRRTPCKKQDCTMSSWSNWCTCSYPCGVGGKQTRKRTVIRPASCGGSCPYGYRLSESRSCNIGCPNGGTVAVGRCICRPGFGGRCCDAGISGGCLLSLEQMHGVDSNLLRLFIQFVPSVTHRHTLDTSTDIYLHKRA